MDCASCYPDSLAQKCPRLKKTHVIVVNHKASSRSIWRSGRRHAFIARERHVGDPRFAAVDLATLLSPDFASEIRHQIHLNRVCALPPSASPMHPSTIYLCVVDRDRNVCSFVNSIAYSFGSAVVAARSGVLLQNRAAGFRIEPGHPNDIAPGKRPLHTLLATLVTRNGRGGLMPRAAFRSPLARLSRLAVIEPQLHRISPEPPIEWDCHQ
jgi:gamma-glutamyltranspeptidase